MYRVSAQGVDERMINVHYYCYYYYYVCIDISACIPVLSVWMLTFFFLVIHNYEHSSSASSRDEPYVFYNGNYWAVQAGFLTPLTVTQGIA